MINSKSIREQVLQNQEAIAIKAISEKIFTLMQNIRNGASDISYQRRWVWELLQNALDTTNSERPTKIQIEINKQENNLCFRHNGNPFQVNNITYLVNQQSSKPRVLDINQRKRTIGKFGTGFITTHLLSERVTIRSTIDANELGHKHFELLLDRSGQNENELYEGVKKSMSILLNLDQLPNVKNYNNSEFNTEFLYHLDEKGYDIANIGIEDLNLSLPYTMAFVRNIEIVEIVGGNVFEYKGCRELAPFIYLHKISINDNKIREILTVESELEDAIIAIEVSQIGNQIVLKELNIETPRLFCNYPFIGTEKFNIPLIFNSSSFNVYQERRNGIILKNVDTQEVNENKHLISECKKLSIKLIEFASNNKFDFKNTYVLANFNNPGEFEWLNLKWYENNILDPIRQIILTTPIVEVDSNGTSTKKAIQSENESVDFPYHADKNIREQIYDLCNTPNFFILPLKDQIHKWHDINWWDQKYDLSIKNLAKFVSDCKNLKELQEVTGVKENFKSWVENFLNLLNNDDHQISLINQNKIAIYPNQNGELVTKNIIHWDNSDIPEELKDILLELGIDIRHKLMDNEIFIQGGLTIDIEKTINVNDVILLIKNKVNEINSEKMRGTIISNEKQLIFKTLYIWLCENPKYSDLFGELYQNKETRLLDEETIKSSIESDQKTKAFLEKFGITDISEIEDLLKSKKENKEKNKKELYTSENILTSMGITSLEDLEKAKQQFSNNEEIMRALNHISSNDLEKLNRVMQMISRSKENIKKKLESNPNYDCTNWCEIGLTTVSGLKKNGLDIQLVVRPGDGNQIILFYQSEFDVLENNINELWYDKGDEQGVYTFGRFLKSSKISRMPL